MSYNIETRSISEFVTDSKIKLPRFQRKSTWNAKQNFELAISIFQEYPVGVVIINDEGHTSWLLDGRQRRSALKDLRANPDLVYDWARKYIKFKNNQDDVEVKQLFWEKIDAYLQQEEDDEETREDIAEDIVAEPIPEINDDEDINKLRQREGLKTLLDIILMVHQKKNNEGKWVRIFNQINKYIERPPYAPKREGFKIIPEELRQFLLEYKNKVGNPNKDNFIQYMDDKGAIKEDKEQDLKKEVDKSWDDIEHIVKVIAKSEQIISDARIGVILLKNVTPLDAQNIFSRINSGGTQLKAEELLSAKPFWNEKVVIGDGKMLDLVNDLYTRLEVETPTDNCVVRWDYGATLISRIKDKHLIFEDYLEKKSSQEIDMTQITLGFKLISSYFNKGMSAIVVNELERNKEIKWGQSIDELVDDINTICEILLKTEFFKYLRSWNKSLYKLLGAAPTLEYITILIYDWHEKGSPRVSSAEYNTFIRDAKLLFDRLIFEYCIGSWKGSGDSKMANHIKNWHERVAPMDEKSWKALIEEACEGTYNGQPLDIKHLTPLLCYQYALQKKNPESPLEETSEVDHIIPQAKLEKNSMVPAKYKDALFNLQLLPKADNIQKKDKTLAQVDDSFLRQSISKYTGISESDFTKYSDASNINEMKKERLAILLKVFGECRITELSN
ncbi:MAG: DUF262 domain-containing protein [Prevotella sp.]|nr:DUF262 domain-containing protein [Prevotella sp.]